MAEDTGGTYTLIIRLSSGRTVTVGARGDVAFEPGWYAYTGSALGPGGFARIDRHRELAAGERETRHWHVDYLLGSPEASVDTVVRSAGEAIECAVATAVDAEPVPDFGCSDCNCPTHLHYAPDRTELIESVRDAHRAHR